MRLRVPRRPALLGFLAGGLVLLGTDPVSAQTLGVSGRVSSNASSFESTVAEEGMLGVGGKVLITVPLVGLRAEGTADYWFPDCTVDCDFYELGLNLLWTIPTPAVPVDPYLGAGAVFQNVSFEGSESGEGGDDSDTGLNLVAGLAVGSAPAIFGEARVLVMPDFENQTVFSLGLTFPLIR